MSEFPDVVGTVFSEKNKEGDFEWMIKQHDNMNALFIFNDNEADMLSDRKGGGNACVRPYNTYGYRMRGRTKPASVGIPTGRVNQGYVSLDEGKESIDFAVNHIRNLLENYEYDTIYFSEGAGGLIGCGIFNVPYEVRVYITKSLRNL